MSWFYLAQLVSGSQIPHTQANPATINTGLKILYAIVGAMAILLIVIAGLRYILKSSDPNSVEESKRMLAYTLVGLVVVALAATVVEFVLKAAA